MMENTEENEVNGDGEIFDDSDSSSPSTPVKPFEPLYIVQVTDTVKNGEVLQFTVKTKKAIGDGEEVNVSRQFEDFVWLHHCIAIKDDLDGVILPPLPQKPLVEAKSVAQQTKKELGKDAKVLKGDNFQKDERRLEKYLKQVVNHYLLGKDDLLEKFLMHPEPPVRAKVKKGILGRLSSAVESRKGSHKDIDEYFQTERDWLDNYGPAMKEMSRSFTKMINAQERFCVGCSHLTAALTMGGSMQDEASTLVNQHLIKFAEVVEDCRRGLEVDSTNDASTLGFQLDLYARYLEAEKDMLFRRTCLLVQYEDANKSLDKAKPQKREAAEEAKHNAETAFENCSDVARQELKQFHRTRILAMQEGLTSFAEAKIKTARDTYALLAKSLSTLKQMELPASYA